MCLSFVCASARAQQSIDHRNVSDVCADGCEVVGRASVADANRHRVRGPAITAWCIHNGAMCDEHARHLGAAPGRGNAMQRQLQGIGYSDATWRDGTRDVGVRPVLQQPLHAERGLCCQWIRFAMRGQEVQWRIAERCVPTTQVGPEFAQNLEALAMVVLRRVIEAFAIVDLRAALQQQPSDGDIVHDAREVQHRYARRRVARRHRGIRARSGIQQLAHGVEARRFAHAERVLDALNDGVDHRLRVVGLRAARCRRGISGQERVDRFRIRDGRRRMDAVVPQSRVRLENARRDTDVLVSYRFQKTCGVQVERIKVFEHAGQVAPTRLSGSARHRVLYIGEFDRARDRVVAERRQSREQCTKPIDDNGITTAGRLEQLLRLPAKTFQRLIRGHSTTSMMPGSAQQGWKFVVGQRTVSASGGVTPLRGLGAPCAPVKS